MTPGRSPAEPGKNFGICLSGGAARGIAHAGVLQALEENGLAPDVISGVSSGALVGALYAAGVPPRNILRLFQETPLRKVFRPQLPGQGLTDHSFIRQVLAENIPVDDFGALRCPLFVGVTNLSQGRFEVFSSGALLQVLLASSAIPVLFQPRHLGPDVFLDGAVLNNLPVEPIRPLCRVLLGVNVTPIFPASSLHSLWEVGIRTVDLVMWAHLEDRLKYCDVAIEPRGDRFGPFEVSRSAEIFEEGYSAALPKMSEIKDRIGAVRSES